MLIQAAKQEISDYFRKQNFEVLDLFYKMPCNSCMTVEKWDHFEFFPDILLKKNEKLILCFVIFSKDTLSKCEEFIKKNSKIDNYKIFLYEDHSFYEQIGDEFSLVSKELNPSFKQFNSSLKTYKSIQLAESGRADQFQFQFIYSQAIRPSALESSFRKQQQEPEWVL